MDSRQLFLLWIKNDILYYIENPPDEEWKTIITPFNFVKGFINYSHTLQHQIFEIRLVDAKGHIFIFKLLKDHYIGGLLYTWD